MAGMINVSVMLNGKTRNVVVEEGSTIIYLMEKCVERGVVENLQVGDFYLVHEGKSMQYGNNETLHTYAVVNASVLSVCLRVQGGKTFPLDNYRPL